VRRRVHRVPARRRRDRVGVEDAAREPCGADVRRVPPRVVDRPGNRSEELPGDTPAGLLLQGTAPGPEDAQARLVRSPGDRSQEAGLADAGRPFDDRYPARARAYLVQMSTES